MALLITVLCVRCARGWPNWAAFQFFEVVTLWFLGVFLIFFLMHLFKLHAKMSCINWPLTVRTQTFHGFLTSFCFSSWKFSGSSSPPVMCSFWMSLSLYEEPQSPDLVKTAATEVRKSFSGFGTSCIIANVVVKVAAALWNQMFVVAFWGFGFGFSMSRTFVTALLNLFLTSKTAVLSSYRKICFFFFSILLEKKSKSQSNCRFSEACLFWWFLDSVAADV